MPSVRRARRGRRARPVLRRFKDETDRNRSPLCKHCVNTSPAVPTRNTCCVNTPIQCANTYLNPLFGVPTLDHKHCKRSVRHRFLGRLLIRTRDSARLELERSARINDEPDIMCSIAKRPLPESLCSITIRPLREFCARSRFLLCVNSVLEHDSCLA
jgi:hypothetical protein